MKLGQIIETVLKEQDHNFKPISVDLTISNGNILLRSFRIYDLDLKKGMIKGLTQQEEYAHVREEREPVYCYLKLEEIKDLACPYLGLEFSSDEDLVKA